MEKNNIRFQAKYKQIEENEVRFEEIHCDDADYLIVAFGSMARIGQKAMELAREEGIKVGMLRPITFVAVPDQSHCRVRRQGERHARYRIECRTDGRRCPPCSER